MIDSKPADDGPTTPPPTSRQRARPQAAAATSGWRRQLPWLWWPLGLSSVWIKVRRGRILATSHQPPAQLSQQRVYRAGPAQSSAGLAQISWGLVGLNTCPSSLLPRLYSSLSALSCYIIIQQKPIHFNIIENFPVQQPQARRCCVC